MPVQFLKDNLPWIAPSAAIVLAATGFFDRSGGDSQVSAPAQVAEVFAPQAAQPATAVAATVAAPAPEPQVVSRNAGFTTSLGTVGTGQGEGQQRVSQSVAIPEPAVVPQEAALASPETISPVANPAAFFGAAQAGLAKKNLCVKDLQVLAERAQVYFPSGGVSAEEAGMGQARLIGLVAAECPGVRIQVEGHSDRSGNPDTNMRLSKKRAESIISRIAASGIDTSKFVAIGYGDKTPSTIRGPLADNYYDRRVEFSVIEVARPAAFSAALPQWASAACVAELEAAVKTTKVFYKPRSVTVSQSDMEAVYQLAAQAQACPQARLRVIGQHSDDARLGESFATGRLRAAALMSALVSSGVASGEIIIAAPSWSVGVPGQPGLSNSRIDFDVIREES